MLIEALQDAVAPHVGVGRAVPGAVLGVLERGVVRLSAVGGADPAGDTPLRVDALIRASSNTKPITAAVTMMLAADGLLALDDPIERFLPELADRRVLPDPYAPLAEAEPTQRSITVDDLLTMRMGFGFVLDGESPALTAAAAAGLGIGPPIPDPVLDVDTWLARFAALPLMRPPGTAWMYDLAFGVLGAVLTRASGQPLDTLYRERVFAPLGMADTAFVAPPGTLVPQWSAPETADGSEMTLFDPGAGSAWEHPPAFPDARGGLVTTATDLLRFAALLLGGGTTREGLRLLDPADVTAMTSDQLTADQRAGPEASVFLGGRGWGRGVEVVTPEHGPVAAGHPVRTPRYGWAGGLGTLWFSYPEHDTAAVLLTQVQPPSAPVFAAFETALANTVDGATS